MSWFKELLKRSPVNKYWVVTLKGGAKVIASNEEFNKISPEVYLSAMRLECLSEAIIMLWNLTKKAPEGYNEREIIDNVS